MDGRKRATSLRTWRTWVGAVTIAVAAATLVQWLMHGLFMRLDMLGRHFVSGALHAAIIAIPVILFLAWRSTAHKEESLHRRVREIEAHRDDLTNMLVHDLKNPVITAGLAIRSVLRDREEGDRAAQEESEKLEIARASLKRAESMIGDILDVGRAEARGLTLSRTRVDLAALVRKQVAHTRPRAEDEGIRLVLNTGTEPLPTRLDANKIRRVIDNLLENALSHTPRGGETEVAVTRTGGEDVVTVRDTGPGVPGEYRDRIFEKYAQAEAAREGRRLSAGLGLVFCKLVVEAHGGRIWVETPPDGGSRFAFAVPVASGDGETS